MKFYIKKDGSEAIMSFSDKDVEILKKNKNNFIIKRADLPHLKNHLMKVIFTLANITENDKTSSFGNEEIIPQDISKK